MYEVEKLAWKWDPSPAYDYLNFIHMDSFQEILAFGGRTDQESMVVVKGNQPLLQNKYHCWTIYIEHIWNAEVMVGVATEIADFTESWNPKCRIGLDENSWALSCGGFQYTNLSRDTSFYPVVGVARQCALRLVSAHVSEPSLQLLSLVSYIIGRCKVRSVHSGRTMAKKPKDSSLQWCGMVPMDLSQLPPGLMKDCTLRYPWFSEDHRKTPYTRIQSQQRQHRNKFQVPKVIRLANPFEKSKLVVSPRRVTRNRKCHCDNSNPDRICSHEKVLRFFRKRDICYLSSSDDEIFPQISKKKRKRLRR
ncbi:uncharacterized protein LOC121872673 isoform X3 [Homarus americanus]|uniref:uncharacterized protein LOC121872673 isoform X3 n=1 Tax=Homarus americanus TaxID=6706 RepID=UPI001C43AC3B|nr:uncharacterized protein LOC121872673 isoform X3 [Homarus americanus]